MIQKLLLLGGDKRASELACLLEKDGYMVQTLGLRMGDEERADIQEADALLFPYPFAVKNGCVPTYTGLTLHPEDVLQKAAKGTVVLAGRGLEPYVLCREMMEKNFCFKRLNEDHELEERNAEISAEAALCEAMQRTDRFLKDMKLLVTGYGLFGRALAGRLKALGAEVWVCARREQQLQLAANDGMHPLVLDKAVTITGSVDMVLNTIPAQVIPEAFLRGMKTGSWLLELASAPYGFDRELAQTLGLQCAVLPALPAYYAPVSAALALEECVQRLLREV